MKNLIYRGYNIREELNQWVIFLKGLQLQGCPSEVACYDWIDKRMSKTKVR